jgi:hypothetical protein
MCLFLGCSPGGESPKLKYGSHASRRPVAPPAADPIVTPPRPVDRSSPFVLQKTVTRLPIEGIFLASGWMGTAEDPNGGLEYRTCKDGRYHCDQWSYTPRQTGPQFAAVAYQHLKDGQTFNFGQQPGMDLSKRGFTRLVFFAKGAAGGERIVFHSGGHARAPYPATYEASLGLVTLSKQWVRFSISLDGCNLSNTTAALVFVLTPRQCPNGCVFYLRDVAFDGPAAEK